jgi:hypothetical protein
MLLKSPASSYTTLHSESLQVNTDLQCTPITSDQRDAIDASDGMIIFNEDNNGFEGYFGSSWNTIMGGATTMLIQATGTLSSSNIDNMHSTPIQLIAGQGTGTVIVPCLTSLQFIPGVTGYVGATGFNPIIYRGTNIAANRIGNYQWAASPSVLSGSTGIYQSIMNQTTTTGTYIATTTIDNQAIFIADGSSAPFPSGGNGTIKWKITYTVQQLG